MRSAEIRERFLRFFELREALGLDGHSDELDGSPPTAGYGTGGDW